MKLYFFKFILLLCLIVLSCKKKDEPAIISAGFTSDNPTSVIQGTARIQNIKIGLNTVADRDIYIKYAIEDYYKNAEGIDGSYFIIRKGEQFKNISFSLVDKKQKEDYNIYFYINKVYNANLDNSFSQHILKVKTNYVQTQGTGSLEVNGSTFTSGTYSGSFVTGHDPSTGIYRIYMHLTDYSYIGFVFYKFPENGKTYTIGAVGSGEDYVVTSIYSNKNYDVYKGLSGTLKVTDIDPIKQTLKVSFEGTYEYGDKIIKGSIDFTRYNFN